MGETLLPKKLALPVFCSDPLSSNAYATEEILLMLSLGGLALLHLTPWVAGAVVLLLVVVVAVLPADLPRLPRTAAARTPSAGPTSGANAALVAASALLVDYVLTVAVSVAPAWPTSSPRCRRSAPHAVRAVARARRGAGADEPARGQGVRHGVRDPDLRLRRRSSS